MRQDTSGRYLGPMAAALSAVFWGASFVAMKYALQYFHPVTMIFLRLAIAAILCLALLPFIAGRQRYTRGDWRIFLAMALCEPCLYFLFEGYALRFTSASQAGMLVSTLPVFVGVLAYIMLKEHISRTGWAGCLMAIGGAIWLSMGAVADEHAPHPLLGNVLECCAMLCAAMYAICVRRLAAGYSALFITSVQAVGGALFFLPAMLLPDLRPMQGAPLSAWLSILFLGLGISLGAYGLYNFSITRMPAARASMYMNLIPVFALAMGMLVLGERLAAPQYAASLLVLAGVIVSQIG